MQLKPINRRGDMTRERYKRVVKAGRRVRQSIRSVTIGMDDQQKRELYSSLLNSLGQEVRKLMHNK